MQQRLVSNVLVSGFGIFSLIGWLGPKIFTFLGAVEHAKTLHEMVTLVRDWNVSWDGIYLLITVICICALIGVNFDLFIGRIEARKISKSRYWNCPLQDAIDYITNASSFSIDLNQEKLCEAALDAFKDAAGKGKILVSGSSQKSLLPKLIPRSAWKKYNMGFRKARIMAIGGEKLVVDNITLIDKDNNKSIRYYNFLVDKDDIYKVFPSRN